jgi:hypothetical protein
VSDANKNKTPEKNESTDAVDDPVPEKDASGSASSGPKFSEAPDPLRGVRKGVADAMASMEGKTVSMKLYVGTIIGVVILMLLARCGGQ